MNALLPGSQPVKSRDCHSACGVLTRSGCAFATERPGQSVPTRSVRTTELCLSLLAHAFRVLPSRLLFMLCCGQPSMLKRPTLGIMSRLPPLRPSTGRGPSTMTPSRAVCAAVALTFGGPSVLLAADRAPEFNRDVRPVLAENCFACHGPDARQRKAGLRLDVESNAKSARKSGAFAIVPGSAAKSELIARLRANDDGRMPPAESG